MKKFLEHKKNDNAAAGALPAADYLERLIVSDIDGEIAEGAVFEVKSETGGFLLPRLTGEQKTTMTATSGLMVYDTNMNRANAYSEGTWIPLEDGTVKKITAGEGFNFGEITREGIIYLPQVTKEQTITSPSSIQVDRYGRVLKLISGPSLTKVVASKIDTQIVDKAPDFVPVQWGSNDSIEIDVKDSKNYLTDLNINIGVGCLDNGKKYIQGIFEYSDDNKATWKPFGTLPAKRGQETPCHFGSVIALANEDILSLISYSGRALITTDEVPAGNKLYFRLKLRSHSLAAKNRFMINGTSLSASADNMTMISTFSATVSEQNVI